MRAAAICLAVLLAMGCAGSVFRASQAVPPPIQTPAGRTFAEDDAACTQEASANPETQMGTAAWIGVAIFLPLQWSETHRQNAAWGASYLTCMTGRGYEFDPIAVEEAAGAWFPSFHPR